MCNAPLGFPRLSEGARAVGRLTESNIHVHRDDTRSDEPGNYGDDGDDVRCKMIEVVCL